MRKTENRIPVSMILSRAQIKWLKSQQHGKKEYVGITLRNLIPVKFEPRPTGRPKKHKEEVQDTERANEVGTDFYRLTMEM